MKFNDKELSSMIQNSSINISLTGWPATVSVLAICVSAISIYALNITHTR